MPTPQEKLTDIVNQDFAGDWHKLLEVVKSLQRQDGMKSRAETLDLGETIIQLKNISKEYSVGSENITALKSTNLEIKEKEFIAIVGPSGSGKSIAMRRLANKVRAQIEEDRENLVELRKEDKTIPQFTIPHQHLVSLLAKVNKVSFLKEGVVESKEVKKEIHRGDRLLISGPNGIGKSTLLKSFLAGHGIEMTEGLRVGYYSQDFSELNFEHTGLESLSEVALDKSIPGLFSAAGRFLLSGELLENKIRSFSEGQKGLLCYARFMLQEPGLLIMDEPTNHINFRHLPIIAKAVSEFKGGVILISHIPEFIQQIGITDEIDLTKL